MIKSISWPNMFNSSSTNIVSEEDATYQNLRLLLLSEQGTLFGDPYYGIDLRKCLYEQNYYEIWDDLLSDKIYTAISEFMPQLKVNRKDIKVNRDVEAGKLSVSISVVNVLNFKFKNYNIVLLQM